MKNLEWTFIDKTDWPDGPWMDEPDKVQWTDERTGLPCLARRNPIGALCGYVGVDEVHPWHRIGFGESISGQDGPWGDCPAALVTVHGGLTYSDFCAEENEEHGICHVTEPGDPDPVWWFGFDCGHAFDLVPSLLALVHRQKRRRLRGLFKDCQYRDLDYVREECASLARQLAEVPETFITNKRS